MGSALSLRHFAAKTLVAIAVVAMTGACQVEETPQVGMQALIFGELEADREQECLHLGASTVWPDGIEVRTDPLRLADSDGRTRAEPGEVVRFAGGSGVGDEALPPGSCRVGDSVLVLNEFLGKGPPDGVE